MIGNIIWVGDNERTYSTRNGEMKSRKIAVRFQGQAPEGLPADSYREDGSIFGEISYKTKSPAIGQQGDIDCIIRQFPSGDAYVAFKRKQQPGVPLNGNGAANGHAAPVGVRSQPSSPVVPRGDKATFLEFAARYGVGLGLMSEVMKEHFPGLTEADRARLSRDAMGPFVVEWLRDAGCQLPNLMDGGMKAYQAEDGDAQTDSVPF
jgi:hypothetical protein